MTQSSFLRFTARNPAQTHRAATPLELMFDLAAVIAIAAAAHGLAHAIEEAHAVQGVIGFLCSFFMIWLAWMNYTWFASAYDDDSVAFRVITMGIMFGALMLAAGIGAVFTQAPIWLALFGFVVMRIGMVVFWLGAARGDPDRRATALGYATGITVLQVYWIVFIVTVPPGAALYLPLFIVGVVGELAVPALAERRGTTAWHRHHLIERYGLLNIIVLGETFIAITAMIQLEGGSALPDTGFMWLAILSAIIAFSLWGLYFSQEEHLARAELRHVLLWGYGHFVVFAAGAAVGAGMIVMMQSLDPAAHIGPKVGVLATAIPAAIYLAMLWLIRDRFCLTGIARWMLLIVAGVIVMIAVALPMALELIAALLGATVLIRRKVSGASSTTA